MDDWKKKLGAATVYSTNPDFKFEKEDDETETITTTFNIQKVPTFIYYKNGEICNRMIGTDKGKIEELINEYL